MNLIYLCIWHIIWHRYFGWCHYIKCRINLRFRALMLPFLGSQLRTIFFIEDYKMMPCLPLKTGTTNWQRALVSLLYVEDGQPKLDPNDVVKVR